MEPPVDLKVGGIDPGHAVDEAGRRYLFLSEGRVVPLTDDGLATAGEPVTVYEGWPIPRHWQTECACLESPKLIRRDGYYYLLSAQGGTAGPATSHMVVAARAKSLMGPWENSPPITPWCIRTAPRTTGGRRATARWWMVYHAYAKGYHTLGRSTLLEPVEWTADGWFRTAQCPVPTALCDAAGARMPLSDDFSGSALGLQWTFWNEYAPSQARVRQQALHLKGRGAGSADGRLLLATPGDKNYEAEVQVSVGRGNRAGLVLFYNEKAFAGVVSDGQTFTVHRGGVRSETHPNRLGRTFRVRLRNRGNRVQMAVGGDGTDWIVLAEDVDVSALHHNNYGGFGALRVGLLSAGRGEAVFRNFRYRNAVPQEKDMAAYLMVFHQDETHGLHMVLSRDGYTFTALNDGHPVLAGDTIALQKGIRDPHIMRGPDGAFYLSMTDLHIYAQRDGYRDTEWERDGRQYGWGNNRGLVLMKS